LKKVEKSLTPKSKLTALSDIYKLVVDSIEVFSKKKDGAGAEDSMPILVYLFSRSEFEQVISTIKYFSILNINSKSYIDLFGKALIKSQALEEYCFRAVKGVIALLKEHGQYFY